MVLTISQSQPSARAVLCCILLLFGTIYWFRQPGEFRRLTTLLFLTCSYFAPLFVMVMPNTQNKYRYFNSAPVTYMGVQVNPSAVPILGADHDDVMKWKYFPRYWPFVRGIHRPPVNSPHKGQWRGALMLSLIWTWINGWVNHREAGDLRRHHTNYDVIVMWLIPALQQQCFGFRVHLELTTPCIISWPKAIF